MLFKNCVKKAYNVLPSNVHFMQLTMKNVYFCLTSDWRIWILRNNTCYLIEKAHDNKGDSESLIYLFEYL